MALTLGALKWVVPWLGRRGDLNALIEGIIRSSLLIPVAIESIDTEPLSQLTVTRLRSVNARAEERFSFGAGAVSIRYDPVELLGGRIRQVLFEKPELFINLDANLAGIAKVPEIPAGPKRKEAPAPVPEPPAGAPATLLPFSVDGTTIEQGAVTLRFGGRDLALTNLQVEVTELGKVLGQRFQLSVGVLGGSVRAWGGVDVLIEAGKPVRYAFRSANVIIDGVDASRLLDWFAAEKVARAWIESAALRARGTVQLEGSLEGTWPEKVSLALATHASDLSASYGGDVSMEDANIGLHVWIVSIGDLEEVRFTVATHGTGSLGGGGLAVERHDACEDGSVEIEGELLRLEGPGGLLRIAPSKLVLAGAGEAGFSGKVTGILGDGPPALDLALEVSSLDLRALFLRLPPVLRARIFVHPAADKLGGDLRAKVRVTGDALKPRADGSFEVLGASVPAHAGAVLSGDIRGSFKDLEADTRTWAWTLGHGQVESGDLGARELADGVGLGGKDRKFEGKLRARVELNEQCYPPGSSGVRARVELGWSSGGLELARGFTGLTGLEASLALDGGFNIEGRKLALEAELTAAAKEILAGSLYANLESRPVTIRAAGSVVWDRSWRVEAASIGKLTASTPISGPFSASGQVLRSAEDGASAALSIDATFKAAEIPAAEAFRVFVAEPLASSAPFLEEARLGGQAALDLRCEGALANPVFWGRLALSGSSLFTKHVTIHGLELDLPFELGERGPGSSSTQEGFIHAREILVGAASLEEINLPVRILKGAYVLEPSRFRLHGGVLDLEDLEISPWGPRGPSARAVIRARGLEILDIARSHGLPSFPGRLDIDFEPLLLEGSRVESNGTIALKAFGGEMTFVDLTLENIARPYSDLRLREGIVHRVRLGEVGKTFHFGVMSGVLEGTVRNLGFTGGELTSFEVDVQTVPARGVPQYLNRGAIESIRRVFTGPLGTLEESLFSKFRYADFGFWARLEDGVFRLRGKHREGEAEYLMRGRWYQFPRVSIINGRPDQPYDWKSIVWNLRKIYESEDE